MIGLYLVSYICLSQVFSEYRRIKLKGQVASTRCNLSEYSNLFYTYIHDASPTTQIYHYNFQDSTGDKYKWMPTKMATTTFRRIK